MSRTAFFHRLINPVKNYPWGSTSAMNELFNLPNPDHQPQAELWMGIHPAGCSVLDEGDNRRPLLTDYIARDPQAILGQRLFKRFGTLPYLMKVLSADRALSVQVHPEKSRAEQGFSRQLDSQSTDDLPDYNDANHKPELVYALTRFKAMNGFRPVDEIIALLRIPRLPALSRAIDDLANTPTPQGLETFFGALMALTPEQCRLSVTALVDAADHFPTGLETFIYPIARDYPGDIGLFAPLLLNCITLAPGEAMFLAPGTLHAYVQGTAVEVMASSDNVLRAGLTGKRINVTELIACTRFTPTPFEQLIMAPDRINEGYRHYPVPVEDFQFAVFEKVNQLICPVSSAEIILSLEGEMLIQHPGGESLALRPGQSAFIRADCGSYSLTTVGKACRSYF